MKIYDQLRCDVTVAIAGFTDQYQDDNKLSSRREKDLQAIHKIINHHDGLSDAHLFSQDLSAFTEKLGFTAFSWMRSLSVYQLKHVLAQVLAKTKYERVILLRTMYREEKANTVRVEEILESKMRKMQAASNEQMLSLEEKLSEATDEIGRLKREVTFLTSKLVECRKKVKTVEAQLAVQSSQSQMVLYGVVDKDNMPSFQQPSGQVAILVRQSDLWQQKTPQTAVPFPTDNATDSQVLHF